MEILINTTQYLFMVTMLGMAAATAYFWLERDSLAPEFRPAATVAGIYTGLAAFMYFQMHMIVGTGGDIASLLALPVHYRYIDWVITTPLMLLNLTLLLQLAADKRGVIGVMLAADIAMITFGYFGERYANIPGMEFEAWTLFGMGCMAWLLLAYILYGVFGDAAKGKVLPVQQAFSNMRLFVTIGWAIYPLGFVAGMLATGDEARVWRELVYNVADLVNKVGLGLVALAAAQAVTRDLKIRQAMRDL